MGSELPLVALGPDSAERLREMIGSGGRTDNPDMASRLAKCGESTPQPSPQVATVGESKPPAKEGGGTLADVRIPSRAMDATDAAIVRGERADIAILLAAERRAWNAYASELAHQVIRETLAALGSKP